MQKALIIGCGKIAGGFNQGPDDAMVLTHALAYTRHPEFRLVAACDPDPAARARFMETWGWGPERPDGPVVYNDLAEALQSHSFDIASVCTPTHTHIDILEQLLETDIPKVFCEKPLGGDPVKAKAIAEKYAKAGKALAVNFTRRWDTAMVELRDEITRGDWGELRDVFGEYGRGVMNNGTHMLDLVTFLTGKDAGWPRRPSVHGHSGNPHVLEEVRDDGVRGDPTVHAVFGFRHHRGGAVVLSPNDDEDLAKFELRLYFTKGAIDIVDRGFHVVRRRDGKPEVANATGYGTALLRALDELAAWPNASLSSNAETAYPSIRIAYEAQQIGQQRLAELAA